MKAIVSPSEIRGVIQSPPSKSYTIRAFAAAMLTGGTTIIRHPSACDDAMTMLNILKESGCGLEVSDSQIAITGTFRHLPEVINCGESGFVARLMLVFASLYQEVRTVIGCGSLLRRRFDDDFIVLQNAGIHCQSLDGLLPANVKGPLRPGEYVIEGSKSSQIISGLMMILPLLEGHSILRIHQMVSRPYVEMTARVTTQFGILTRITPDDIIHIPGKQHYCPTDFTVEGDWSGAAFLIVAAWQAGEITISGLNPESLQADRYILQLGQGKFDKQNQLHVKQISISCFDLDCRDFPDLVPVLSVLALNAREKCRIRGIDRLKNKESHRPEALRNEFSKLGLHIQLSPDEMIIHPGRPRSGEVDSHRDHRIAMALTIAALNASGPVIIHHADCVAKSYPNFFDHLKKLGANIVLIED